MIDQLRSRIRGARDVIAGQWRMVMARRRARLMVLAASVVVFAGLARCAFETQASEQVPNHLADSIVYIETASQPFAMEHVFYPKPVFVPVVYRALGVEDRAIQRFQESFALIAWSLLGATLVLGVRRRRARAAGIVIICAFLFAPYRVGFTGTILSESINDSLTALLTAAALALAMAAQRLPVGRRRSIACWSLAGVLFAVGSAWLLTRDTNAITGVFAVVCGAIVWRLHAHLRRDRWAAVLAIAAIAMAGVVVWSSGVIPDPPTHLSLHAGWQREILARGTFSTINNVLGRVIPNPRANQYFVDHGMPQEAELRPFQGGWAVSDPRFLTDPQLAPARTWIGEHGTSTYAKWLLHHPIERADEVAVHLWDVVAPRDLDGYMPQGWDSVGIMPTKLVRGITREETLLLALLLSAPMLLRRPRDSGLGGVALVLVVSGTVGAAAAYYGDTLEISRHCYGAGQQIVLGLYLSLIAFLDRPPRVRDPAPPTRS